MINFPDKYHLTPEQSVFLAKKKWDENVYCGMKMENRNVTFPQTQTILQGINVPNVQLDDIQAILNMRDAWKYLLNTINIPISLEYMCKINWYVARNESLEWGVLRNGAVCISGTEYIPPVPVKEKVEQQLGNILKQSMSSTEKALNIFALGTRSQFFWDGNKRTSLLLANKIMLENRCGMLTIPQNRMEQFNCELLEYYNSGNKDNLLKFLYDYAIQGIEL